MSFMSKAGKSAFWDGSGGQTHEVELSIHLRRQTAEEYMACVIAPWAAENFVAQFFSKTELPGS